MILLVINTPKAISGHSDKPELYLKHCEGLFSVVDNKKQYRDSMKVIPISVNLKQKHDLIFSNKFNEIFMLNK